MVQENLIQRTLQLRRRTGNTCSMISKVLELSEARAHHISCVDSNRKTCIYNWDVYENGAVQHILYVMCYE